MCEADPARTAAALPVPADDCVADGYDRGSEAADSICR